MNKQKFRKLLMIGHGRCYLLARQNPEMYKDEILYACSNTISYEALTHIDLIFDLINLYNEKSEFIQALKTSFEKRCVDDEDFGILYFGSILLKFLNEDESIKKFIWEKYLYIHHELDLSDPSSQVYLNTNQYGDIVNILLSKEINVSKILEHLDDLLKKRDDLDLDWIVWGVNHKGISIENYPYIKFNYQKQLYEDSQIKIEKNDQKWYEKYYNSSNDNDKIIALRYFDVHKYQGDIEKILCDASSKNEKLSISATSALSKVRDANVKAWVNNRLHDDLEKYLPVYITNIDEDKIETLIELLYKVEVSHNEVRWDDIFTSIIDLQYYGIKVSKELLFYIYESSFYVPIRREAQQLIRKYNYNDEQMDNEIKYDVVGK